MKFILFISFLFLIPFACAETTFFDQDDAFVMSSSATSGVIGETTSGTTGGAGCTYKWHCTNWSECFPSGKQTRTCINLGTCPDTYKKPETKKNCSYVSPPQEKPPPVQKQKPSDNITKEKPFPSQPTIEKPPIIPLSFNVLAISALTITAIIIFFGLKRKKKKK